MKITKLIKFGVIVLSFSFFQSFTTESNTIIDSSNKEWRMSTAEFHELLKTVNNVLLLEFERLVFQIPECDPWYFYEVSEGCNGDGPKSHINQCDLNDIISSGGHPMIRSWRPDNGEGGTVYWLNDDNQCM